MHAAPNIFSAAARRHHKRTKAVTPAPRLIRCAAWRRPTAAAAESLRACVCSGQTADTCHAVAASSHTAGQSQVQAMHVDGQEGAPGGAGWKVRRHVSKSPVCGAAARGTASRKPRNRLLGQRFQRLAKKAPGLALTCGRMADQVLPVRGRAFVGRVPKRGVASKSTARKENPSTRARAFEVFVPGCSTCVCAAR